MSGYAGRAFRARMAAGELALGSNLRLSRSAEAGPILAACGFHWAMLDFEHSPASPHLAHDIHDVRGQRAAVRVAQHQD